MKKAAIFILALFLAAVLLCLLCGCGKTADTDAPDGHGKRFQTIYTDWNLNVLVDMETGVEYMRFANRIQPLIDSYGKPYLYPAFDAREDKP